MFFSGKSFSLQDWWHLRTSKRTNLSPFTKDTVERLCECVSFCFMSACWAHIFGTTYQMLHLQQTWFILWQSPPITTASSMVDKKKVVSTSL